MTARLPRGFLASGVRSGVRRRRLDLALIVAPGGADAAAVFTRNRFPAAPVTVSRAALRRSGGRVGAIVVNAGCANAMTGDDGIRAARLVQRRAAALLRCPPERILVASTGVIGTPLPAGKLTAALPTAMTRLSPVGLDAASQAILTTDAGPKVAHASFAHDGRRCRVTGFAKGAGMIHPDMATMLAFVMTDATATPGFLKEALRAAVDESFHAISVDGDTSTNDMVALLASGGAGGARLTSTAAADAFLEAVTKVCRALAWMIVRDGEGATRVMEIEIAGAATEREARLAAHAVATSPLVKTALHGGDPNWGRILAAVGRSGARLSPRRTSLRVGTLALVTNGVPASYEERTAARLFSKERVRIGVDLGAGPASAHLMTCDLGPDYVALNADYRS